VIDVQEHWYDDDPRVGPADVKTALKEVEYFFLGNGRIQAAVQWGRGGEGTLLGLLVMDPEFLGKKRDALTMDPSDGLAGTTLEILDEAGRAFRPKRGRVEVAWGEREGLPAVRAEWEGAGIRVAESFFIPDRDKPELAREVKLANRSGRAAEARIRTRVREETVEKAVRLEAGEERPLVFVYRLDPASRRVALRVREGPEVSEAARVHGRTLASASFGHPLLDHFFRAAESQLPAAVSRSGRVDGSIWQYNREWLRDQSVVAEALAVVGERGPARTMFDRLFAKFVTEDGDTVDSSEKRNPDEVELDQGGFLLQAFRNYVFWTGEADLLLKHWDKVVVAAEFPLRPVFRHEPSGLLANRREFWERHRVHGIEPGLELVHQVYESAGLSAAASLARMAGRGDKAAFWEGEAARLKRATLEDPVFRLAGDGGFIKRRGLDGRIQERIAAWPEANLPAGVPLVTEKEHFLNPDTSAALPIVLEFVPPDSPLAGLTMTSLETLWNQAWTGGGYGRYHFTSEPDSAGPWPFPSIFVARAAVEAGDFEKVWRVLEWLGTLPGAKAGAWFEFYGNRIAPPFPQVGIIPWTWAEMVLLLVRHILGLRPDEEGILIRPRLLPGMGRVEASFPVRDGRVELDLQGGDGSNRWTFAASGEVLGETDRGVRLKYPSGTVRVSAVSRSVG